MSPFSRRRIVRVVIATAVFASAATGLGAAPVGAATATFGAPTASSSFGKGISLSQPYTSSASPKEADIVIDYPGSYGPSIVKLDNPGATRLFYLLDTSAGDLQPNTVVNAHFQVTFADDTVVDGPDIKITYQDDRFQWQTKIGKVVRLHWYEGDDQFAQQALQMAEEGIANAASFLGYAETAPIDFFVYADQAPFYDALGPATRDNVGGQANTDTRTLFALIGPSDLSYAATVVPHELTHVVFDDVTNNPYHFPPHWLNEGIAVYVSQGFDSSDRQLVDQAASDGSLMPLTAIRGQFPTTQDRFYLAYAESVSAVDYFMRTYGHADLDKLVTAFGTGASDDEAFNSAIGLTTDAFDKAWQAANGVTSQKSFGPQPAPTGPLPPGWSPSGMAAGAGAESLPGAVLIGGHGEAGAVAQTPPQGGTGALILLAAVAAAATVLGLILSVLRLVRRSVRVVR